MKKEIDIIVHQPDLLGHGITYLDCLISEFPSGISALVCLRKDITLAPAEAAKVDQWRKRGVQVEFVIEPGLGGPLSRAWVYAKGFLAVIRQYKPKRVLALTGDGMLPMLGLLRPVCLSIRPMPRAVVIIMHQCSFLYPARTLKSRLFNLLSLKLIGMAPCSRILAVDELSYRWAREKNLRGQWGMVRDPILASHSYAGGKAKREQFGIEQDAFVVGCSGLLSERKGVDRLIVEFAQSDFGRAAVLLLVGRASKGVRSAYETVSRQLSGDKRIVFIDGYVPEEVLQGALAAMDIVCVPYLGHHGISSILLRGVVEGKFIVGANYGWIGDVITRYGLGKTCDVQKAGELSRCLRIAAGEVGDFKQSEEARKWLGQHSAEDFSRTILAALEITSPAMCESGVPAQTVGR